MQWYIHTDQLDTPQKMTDVNKNIVWDMVQKPFGETLSIAGSATLKLRFPGQYYDAETNINYNHHRYYDPSLGRFTQPDPIGFRGGTNVFAYVKDDPTRWVDPWGLVNLNMYPPGSPQWQSSNLYNPSGVYSVGGHGNSQGITDDRNVLPGTDPSPANGSNPLSVADLGNMIQNDPNYQQGEPIELHSCSTGQGDNSFAQQLSNWMNTNVSGADNTLYFPNANSPDTTIGPPPNYTGGHMTTFSPNGQLPFSSPAGR